MATTVQDGRLRSPGAFRVVRTCLELYVVAGGIVSLLGWVLDVPRLTDWEGSGISIQPNTTIAVTAAGLALFLLDRGARRAAALLGGFVALVGATVIFQYLAGVDLGIDTLLMFERTWGRAGVLFPGRMGPSGATSWTLVGTALVLASARESSPTRRLVPVLALATASLSSLALIGYLYRAPTLYDVPTITVMAWQTATFILAVSIGLFLSVPEHGPVRLLRAGTPGGDLARRIVPMLLAVPILLGLLRQIGERAGVFDSALGSALRTLLEILLFLSFLWWTAAAIDRQARERALADRQSGASRQRLIEQLEAELGDTRLLQGISTELLVQEDARQLYASILDAASRIMRSDFASLQMLHRERGHDGGELRLLAHRGFDRRAETFWEWVNVDSAGSCWAALQARERVVFADTERLDALRGTEDGELFRHLGIRSMQSTPLVTRDGRVVGMISTHWRAPHEPAERELRLLDILARQAADLIERNQTEAQREELLAKERAARADAERAARLKDEFLATLSHELRTPLNAIIGWTQLLKNDLVDPDRARAAVEVIERNARLQAQLITDLLDISRITSGTMRLDVQAVDLAAVIGAAIDSVTPAAQAKDLRLERTLGRVSAPIQGDPARLQQVVWNLLSNAVKFTPRGGRVHVALEQANAHVEIRVSDTGDGIAPEFLPHIFERFRQADASASRSHGGLGLGLAIVKQFTELHGGTVRATSAGKGQGSTFVIELPLAVSTLEERAQLQDRARSGGAEPIRYVPVRLEGLRVLLVDDEPDALSLVRRVLEESGAAVSATTGTEVALQRLALDSFDVIVSDIGMPGRDGYEFIADVRARGIRVPALALTAFARSEDRTKALLAGYQAHLSKPVETADLLVTVASVAGQRKAESRSLTES